MPAHWRDPPRRKRGELASTADPNDLAVAVLSAIQGGSSWPKQLVRADPCNSPSTWPYSMSHGSMLQARVFSSSPCRRMTRYPKPRALVPSGQEARSRAASDSGLVDILGVAIHHFMARGR